MPPRPLLRMLDAIVIGTTHTLNIVEEFIFVRTTMTQWLFALVLVLLFLLAIQICHSLT
jgi:hypothetical protein